MAKKTVITGPSEKKKPAPPTPKASESGGGRWTFLTNHCLVLVQLHAEPDLVLREVAARVGITERAVQRIILELEEGGIIERQRIGRRNRYRVLTQQYLRHRIERHRKIGDLLSLFIQHD